MADVEESSAKPLAKEHLRADYGYLIDNEDIPDWYVNDSMESSSNHVFDFNKTIKNSCALKPPKPERISEKKNKPTKKISADELFELNPDEIDKQIEQFAKNIRENSDSNDEPDFKVTQKKPVMQLNDSDDYISKFNDNIQKMFIDNDESKAEELESQKKAQKKEADAKIPKSNDAEFMAAYHAFNHHIKKKTQAVFHTKERNQVHRMSVNGFTQSSIDAYNQIPYKIFSFYARDNVFAKVWLYKDNMNHIQGPFMSFDMDIWNSEGNYFSPSLIISTNNSPFFPMSSFVNREPEVTQLFQGKDYPKFDTPP